MTPEGLLATEGAEFVTPNGGTEPSMTPSGVRYETLEGTDDTVIVTDHFPSPEPQNNGMPGETSIPEQKPAYRSAVTAEVTRRALNSFLGEDTSRMLPAEITRRLREYEAKHGGLPVPAQYAYGVATTQKQDPWLKARQRQSDADNAAAAAG